MKKMGFFILLVSFAFIHLSNETADSTGSAAGMETIIKEVTHDFWSGMTAFEKSMLTYRETAQAFAREEASWEDLRNSHFNARLAFKSIEFLMEYLDHSAVKRHVNGPPLPSVTPNSSNLTILEPEGLQVLDELVFDDDPQAQSEEIAIMLELFHRHFPRVKGYQLSVPLEHRYIFEASRQELIRIFTLGVTGFDTPGSLNALPEALIAFQSLRRALTYYYPSIEERNVDLRKKIQALSDQTIQFLEAHQSFETFDRLTFLKEYVNPLYELIYEAQLTLEIETASEVSNLPVAVNPEAPNIFSDHFLNRSYYFNVTSNSITEERIELGKLLFFDPVLSANNERACASCHAPGLAFTDGLDKSLSISGENKILRNAPTLINSIYAENYFLDLREPELERQIKHVVLDTMEFNTDFIEIVEKLKQSETYQELFADAYGDYPQYELSKWSISNALGNYVASLSSFNSPFDQYVRGEINALDAAAKRGFNLFMGKANCGICHFAPTFNGTVPPKYKETESEVLGVPVSTDTINPQLDPDWGRRANSRPLHSASFYQHSFKTTTVRNAAVTAPYMHNGVYQTLEEVLDFYNKGGGLGLGIDIPHQTLPDTPLNLNEQEIQDLIAFMESLTDYERFTKNLPTELPKFEQRPEWNDRPVGGKY